MPWSLIFKVCSNIKGCFWTLLIPKLYNHILLNNVVEVFLAQKNLFY